MTALSRYAALLRLPNVLPPALAALLGRLPTGMLPLALVLFARDATGSYASAGTVAGAFAISSAATAPVLGRLIDRHGQTWVLVGGGLIHPLALAGLLVTGQSGARAAALAAWAALAGVAFPPLSACMRALWTSVADGDDTRQAAYALESVVIEVSFFAGPLLVAVLASPTVAVLVAAVLASGGALGFAASTLSRNWRGAPEGGRFAGPLRSPGMVTLVLAAVPLGISFGVLDVAIPAFAEEEGVPALAGLLIAALSLGSIPAGLWYGARTPRTPPPRQYAPLLLLLALGEASLLLADSIGQMAVLMTLTGLAVAPTTACSLLLVDRAAPRDTVTEAFTWWNTAVVGGLALGNAVAGALIDISGVSAGLLAGSTAAMSAALLVSARRRTLV